MSELQFLLLLRELQEIRGTQHALVRAVAALHIKGDALMAVSKELQDALAKIDTATTAAGARITDLASRVSTDMTPQDVADVVAKLNAESDKLTSLAADPNNPVPPSAAA